MAPAQNLLELEALAREKLPPQIFDFIAGAAEDEITLAIQKKMRLTPDFTNLIQVYPTYSTSVQQLAAEAIYGKLQEPFYRLARRLGSLLG